MKISKSQAIKQNWDEVHSLNYKLPELSPYKSVVFAELHGDHGQVHTNDLERIYYIIEGSGEFNIAGEVTSVVQGDVITIPPQTTYNYRPETGKTLKIILFMELWDN
ncbi:MAG TPA: cupin domain-containing protein [Patescibacteria group bacterium]|nr:cupin domain-containing protein [Patescibacteria group bacterium]